MIKSWIILAAIASQAAHAVNYISLASVKDTTYQISVLNTNGSLPKTNTLAPQGFVGFSLEWQLVNKSLVISLGEVFLTPFIIVYYYYEPSSGNVNTTTSLTDINPTIANLYKVLQPRAKQLSGESRPLLRIGGNSATKLGWGQSAFAQPQPFGAPLGVTIYPGDLQLLNQFATETGYGLILDVSMLDKTPDRMLEFVKDGIMTYIDPRNLWSVQLGNEPDNWVIIYYRPAGWQFNPDYLSEYKNYSSAISSLMSTYTDSNTFAGGFGGMQVYLPQWIGYLPQFVNSEPTGLVGSLAFHRYPLTNCASDPAGRQAATIQGVLNDPGENGLDLFNPVVAAAKKAGIPAYCGECGVASCSGLSGVSDTYATALWGVDMLLDFALRGISKVLIADPRGASNAIATNVAPNGPFIYDTTIMQLQVRPLFYAMVLVSDLLSSVTSTVFRPISFTQSTPLNMRAFAIYDSTNTSVTTIIINKDMNAPATISVTLSLGISSNTTAPPPPATITRLRGPSAASTDGVTLANQTFDGSDHGYIYGNKVVQSVVANADGTYTVTVDKLSVVVVKVAVPSNVVPPSSAGGSTNVKSSAGVIRAHVGRASSYIIISFLFIGIVGILV
ncbi:beta-glucuronidase [Synchytrium microbalum]|uniref:Beta-glucuronidase n=1 Tax=Synchytrium microbalum TaxID=1806994 RepID=A0A507BYS4_9FUNG|nr:beta-glucuronidase [Synchytrium microbalum]TPX32261.1 beta-glucuronidase [Synchytrium microbalum]